MSVIFSLVVLATAILPWGSVAAAEPDREPGPAKVDKCQTKLLSKAAPARVDCPATSSFEAAVAPAGFEESIVWSGLVNPTSIRFAADGRVFVGEKSGVIKVFDSLGDPTPTVFSELVTNTHDFWDRGLLGLALHPSLTGGPGPLKPFVYVLYTYDHILGSTSPAPRWGDTCPTPPGATTDGCVASARLSRFPVNGSTITGPEQVLVEDWCQQYPSHSIGTVEFGSDGALYAGAGDGASFTTIDYGQLGGSLAGTPTGRNPCGDPPGGAMTPPDAAGGALRGQDVRQGGASPAYASLVAADGAVAYWRLGEASGATVNDSRGSSAGTYVGSPTLGVTGALGGDTDTAATFPGVESYVSIPDRAALDLGNGPFSIEFWYRPSTANALRFLLSKGSQFNVYMNPTGNLTVDNDNTAAVQVGAGSGIGSNLNWHYYVITRTGSGSTGMRIYQDGVDVTNFASDQTFASNNAPLYIGRYYDGGFPALGTIDDVALYPTALSQGQVSAHYTAAFEPPSGDPTGLDGAILRLDPETGAAMAGNPLSSSGDPNNRRIIAYGLRNPFRFTLRPGTGELWLGDVGAGTWEEINRVANTGDATVENFGWPCYEGTPRNSGYDNANLSACETLYAQGPGAVTAPFFAYDHAAKVVAGETCPVGSSALAGLAFYPEAGGSFPPAYAGGLFFADHNRDCIWFMPKGTNGQPDPSQRSTFVPGAANPVDLEIGPNGDLFYVDFGGSIRRVRPLGGGNQAPTARIVAAPTSGPAPLDVAFDGTTSSDPEGGALTYRWDLDGDGAYDDSTAQAPTFTFATAGAVIVRLEVTDPLGSSATTSTVITAGSTNTPPRPVIETPVGGTSWGVGDATPITFSGSADDDEDGALASARLSWKLVMQHCPSNCHSHEIETFPGVASGSFFPPDHEYPSYLDLVLTATDADGATASVTRRLDPRTADLSFATSPAGLQLSVAGATRAAPFSQTVIDGGRVSVSAPSPQDANGLRYAFSAWSDGGGVAHDITARSGATYTATYVPASTDIGVTQSVARSGATLTYTIRVTHLKGTAAAATRMVDTLPTKLTWVSTTTSLGTCTRSSRTVTCSVGTLGAGQQAVITIVAKAQSLSGSVSNTATATTSTLELVTSNNSATTGIRLR